QLPMRTIRSAFASNPLDTTSHETTPPPRTQTVPAREVFHNVQAALRPLMAGVQTREQVADLVHGLQDLHQRNMDEVRREQIMDPPVIPHKGRPRTARLTNAREGRQRGGGTSSAPRTQGEPTRLDSGESSPKRSRVGRAYKCSLCREEGHNRSRCPLAM
ncbi:hypothetical protein C8R46DRAFT_903798, partial [Mycena filopes]